jgi:predicted porin
MGIRGVIPIFKGAEAIMQLEVGVGLVGNKTTIKFSGDPGGATGEIDNVFTSRLGYVGVKTKYGQITWGKQWSVYSDIGGWTDNYNAFGGEASGTYSARTDGATSGTGRASNCLQYRLNLSFLEIGIQSQDRNISDSNKAFADTYGASLVFKTRFGLKFGAAFDKVRDGIMNPATGKPKYGDEAMIAGVYYNSGHFTGTFTASSFKNHEIDDLGYYFSGLGFELYSEYRFLEKWNIYGGFNYLDPEADGPSGNYRISYADIGSSYRFGKSSKVFIELRLDSSRNHDGSNPDLSTVGFGMFFDFGY